jgi:hypothetical protein
VIKTTERKAAMDWMEFVKILIFIAVDIFKHTAKKSKKIKRADQILPEVYGTTLAEKQLIHIELSTHY